MFSIISFILATIGTLLKRISCYLRHNLLDMTSESISYPCMPVQSADPVSVALQQSLSTSRRLKGSSESSLQVRIIAPVQQILREEVKYETTNCTNSYLSGLRNKYVVLKSTDDDDESSRRKLGATTSSPCLSSQSQKSNHKEDKESDLPKPRVVLYPSEKVTLGWRTPLPVGSGFSNMGNTCYLNSTLQALFHVPAFVNWLLSDRTHSSKCEMMNGLTHSECLVCAMCKTLQSTHKFNGSSIKPIGIYSKLKTICRHLVHGHQEDAHEFLRYLIEGMERSYLSLYTGIKFDNRSKETTPLNQIFGGYLRNEVTCLECHHVSTTFQHFQDLILDIRMASTVEDALEGYFSREHLGEAGDKAYKCEQCKRRVAATKKFSLERPPKALCIQLKRFGAMGGKNNKHVTFKKWLDITKFRHRAQIGSQIKYKLVALVTHLGHSSSCGHYTAVGQASNGNFYLFDDHMVRELSINNVLNTNAYILMYEMEEKKEEPKTNRPVKLVQSVGESATVSISNGVNSPKSLDRDSLSERSNKPLSRTLSEKSLPLKLANVPISRASSASSIVPSSTSKLTVTGSTVNTSSLSSLSSTPSSSTTPVTTTPKTTSSVCNPSRTLALVPYSTGDSSSDSESEDVRTDLSPSNSGIVSVNGDSRKHGSSVDDKSGPSLNASSTSFSVHVFPTDCLIVDTNKPENRTVSNVCSSYEPLSIEIPKSLTTQFWHCSTMEHLQTSKNNFFEPKLPPVSEGSEVLTFKQTQDKPASQSHVNGHNGEKTSFESPSKNHRSPVSTSPMASLDQQQRFNHGGTWEVTPVPRKLKLASSNNSTGGSVNSQSAGGKCSEKNLASESSANRSQPSDHRRDYHSNSSSHKTVETLEKMNHRGYGYPVNSWAGTKSEIEREIENETSTQKRPLYSESDDDDDDSSRSKVKKLKFNNHRNNTSFKDRMPMKNRFQNRKNEWNRQFNRGRPGGNNMSSRQNFYYQYTMERGKSGWGRQC